MKKNIYKISFFIIYSVALLCIHSIVFAGNRSGTVAEQFLKIPTDARVVGMGGANVAIAEGVSSLTYNPSGLLSVTGMSFSATYTPWFASIQHSFLGAALNLNDIGVIGFGVTALSTDDMNVTTVAFPEGTGEVFRAADYAFHFAYARPISDQFTVGLGGKYIYSSLYNNIVTASSFAFDVGTLYDMPEIRTRLGVSLTNLGGDVQFLKEPYSLPTALRFGAAVTLLQQGETKLLSTLQVARPNDANEQYNVGVEYSFNDMFSLRGGYRFVYEKTDFGAGAPGEYAAGFGINLLPAGFNGKLNYGYNSFHVLPGTHTVTLEFSF